MQKLEAEAASGDMLAFFHLGSIYFAGPIMYGPGAPMDWDKASNYLYKAFLDMRGAFYFLSEDLPRCLQNPPIAEMLTQTATKLKLIISELVKKLQGIIPTLMEKLIEEGERFHFDLIKEEQQARYEIVLQARDEIMLEVFKSNDIPLRLKDLPPKRDGGWYTNAEYHRASEILQSANTPPQGVRLMIWQINALYEVFGFERAVKLYFAIINLESFITEDDLQRMIGVQHKIHPDNKKEFEDYIDEIRQKISAKEDAIKVKAEKMSRAVVGTITILCLIYLWRSVIIDVVGSLLL